MSDALSRKEQKRGFFRYSTRATQKASVRAEVSDLDAFPLAQALRFLPHI
jgi:hypothetical protein